MKLSESLLNEKEFGKKIFESSLNKTKNLLRDVFNLDADKDKDKIISLVNDPEHFKYEIVFDINGRKINALFNYEKDHDDILIEALRIRELEIIDIPVEEVPNDIDKTIIKVMELLENKYDLDFTPFDPEDADKNIKEIKTNEKDHSWVFVFTTDDHEADFIAKYSHTPGEKASLKVEQHKEHIIYFE